MYRHSGTSQQDIDTMRPQPHVLASCSPNLESKDQKMNFSELFFNRYVHAFSLGPFWRLQMDTWLPKLYNRNQTPITSHPLCLQSKSWSLMKADAILLLHITIFFCLAISIYLSIYLSICLFWYKSYVKSKKNQPCTKMPCA